MIRDAQINDLPSISQIEKLCFVKPYKDEELIYELKENPVSLYLVYEIDNQIVGFIDFWITFDSSTIAQIAVHPSFRRRGIALALLNEALNECVAKKANTMTLEVRVGNTAAIGLYEKFGFKSVVIKPHYYDNGEDAIYMVKEVK